MTTAPPLQLQRTTFGPEETVSLGTALGRALRPGDCIALFGELGAGKTQFVRGLAAGLGHDPRAVSSPTFVLMNEYERSGAPPLVHVDAYRLLGADDLEAAGWDAACDGAAVVAVEWAERVAEALPSDRVDVRIEHAGGDARRVTISAPANWSERLEHLGFP